MSPCSLYKGFYKKRDDAPQLQPGSTSYVLIDDAQEETLEFFNGSIYTTYRTMKDL